MSFLAESARRDKQAPSELTAASPATAAGAAPDGGVSRLRAISKEDPNGAPSQSAPWAQRRLNEALAELGPVVPQPTPTETPGSLPSLAETAIAAAAALSRHSPLLAQATISPPPAAPNVLEATSTGTGSPADAGRAQALQTSTIELANDASQIVRALALSCDRETLTPIPLPTTHQRAAVPPLPPPPPVTARSTPPFPAREATPSDLVPAWLVVPPPTPPSLLVEDEAGERPPMIIERAIAEAEQAASESAAGAHASQGRAGKPGPWTPMATGFGLAVATGAVLYAVLVAG